MSRLEVNIEQLIDRHDMLPRNGRVLVAVSGGMDSMILLNLLVPLASQRGCVLVVAHFNHQLRGRSSDLDQQLVESVSKTLNLACVVGSGDVKKRAGRKKLSIEMAARELRHAFLARTARRRRCDTIAIAHHADDQAELVLMRLLRGSGPAGLAGMSACCPSPVDSRVKIVRPLLCIRRSEISRLAEDLKIRFREDRTNRSLKHVRNRVRHELLPLLRHSYQPSVEQNLLRVSDILSAESEFIEDAARKWLRARRPSFHKLPLALQRRVVKHQALDLGLSLDFDAINHLVRLADQIVCVEGSVRLVQRKTGQLEIVKSMAAEFRQARKAVELTRKGRIEFGDCEFNWEMARGTQRTVTKGRFMEEVFDAEKVGRRIVLRYWQAGDRFQPIGMQQGVKLQDLFTNAKVPHDRRRSLIVAESASGKIFWVQMLRIAEGFKVTSDTRKRLVWRWKC